jgi:DNA repair photolyase
MLNKQKGDMYGFVTHTWNPINGKCIHNCEYCYMKVFPQKELKLNEKALGDYLGNGKIIFVGSSTDMFADNVPSEWIRKVLEKCRSEDNTYLFQTKNPIRFKEFSRLYPEKTIFGVTIESNKGESYNAPPCHQRWNRMYEGRDFMQRTMVTIEPIMDFDLDVLVSWIKAISPEFVNIGADSKRHNLKEPTKEKILSLIEELKKFTKVNLKENLDRLIKDG